MDAPFLPPPAADNPPAKKKGSPVFTWLVLFVVFFVVYEWLSIKSVDAPSLPVRLLTGFLALLSAGWPILLLGAVFTYLWWQFRGGSQFQLAQEPGLVALAEGQLESAAATFRAVAARYRRQMQYAAVARYNLAMVLLRQGDCKGAISELIAVEKGAGLLYAAEIRMLAAILLGQCHVLRGELETAQRWIDEARKRLARASHRSHAAAQLRVVEAMLHCRAGRFDEAARGLDRDWRQLEGTMAISFMRVAWLLRAYAATQLGGPRGEGAATPYLTLLRGAPGLDHLTMEWPELRTFLVANGLVSAA